MIEITLSCSMCGREKTVRVGTEHLKSSTTILTFICADKYAGWIAQQNGENLDVYCSKRCAR